MEMGDMHFSRGSCFPLGKVLESARQLAEEKDFLHRWSHA
jgi:hypothetical protein